MLAGRMALALRAPNADGLVPGVGKFRHIGRLDLLAVILVGPGKKKKKRKIALQHDGRVSE